MIVFHGCGMTRSAEDHWSARFGRPVLVRRDAPIGVDVCRDAEAEAYRIVQVIASLSDLTAMILCP